VLGAFGVNSFRKMVGGGQLKEKSRFRVSIHIPSISDFGANDNENARAAGSESWFGWDEILF
jgi:hypothetical protein